MKTNTPSHEEVTRRAEEIWKAQGCPTGRDTEIWLEAERQLSTGHATPSPSGGPQDRGNGNSQATPPATARTAADPKPPEAGASGEQTPSPSPIQAEAQSAQLKKSSRAPKAPTKTAPKAAPAETGKPLWKKPQSS
jgi:hypothetical protein